MCTGDICMMTINQSLILFLKPKPVWHLSAGICSTVRIGGSGLGIYFPVYQITTIHYHREWVLQIFDCKYGASGIGGRLLVERLYDVYSQPFEHHFYMPNMHRYISNKQTNSISAHTESIWNKQCVIVELLAPGISGNSLWTPARHSFDANRPAGGYRCLIYSDCCRRFGGCLYTSMVGGDGNINNFLTRF